MQRGEFDRWWESYPHKVGKKAAYSAYRVARKQVDAKTLLDGVASYAKHKPHDRPWCNPATWLNQGRWEDQPSEAKPKRTGSTVTDRDIEVAREMTRRINAGERI